MTEIIKIAGTAVWPRLTQPDTKFDDAGKYHTKLRIDAETAEPLIEKLEALREERFEEVKASLKGKAPLKEDIPIQPEYDEETEEETGYYIFSAGMLASGVSKKTGKAWNRKLPLFDGKGAELSSKVSLFGGASLILAVTMASWEMKGKKVKGKPQPPKVGVKFYLEAVQVLSTGGNGGGTKVTFGAVEGAEEIVVPEDDIADEEEEQSSEEAGADAYDFD